ncbi:hypothetical protein CHUAL_004651 [Chamberlinius hualienensis]
MLSAFKVLRGDEKIAISKLIPRLKFASKIEPDLKCIRCGALPVVKHYTADCQHLYCSECFNILRADKNPQCSECQERLDKLKLRKSDLEIERKIFNLKVFCPNKKDGCQETIALSNILEHLRSCPYPLVTTVTNGNFNTNGTQLTEMKESVQRAYEGLNPIIKEKSAVKLREELQNKLDNWFKNTEEQLRCETSNLKEFYQLQIEQMEKRFKDEMAEVESKQIHNTFLQLKADFGHDLSNFEENTYTMNEKMLERLAKQDEQIEKLGTEIEILSSIIRSQEAASSKPKNENITILLCGPHDYRTAFIQAIANYFTFETSKLIEDGGLIQLNPVYTLKKSNDTASVDQTELYQFPIDEMKWVRIISWESPSNLGRAKSPTFDSNYASEESEVSYQEFELLENPLFSILDNQFPQINAIVFLANTSNIDNDSSYFRLLNYVDRQNFKQAVKYVFVNDTDTAAGRTETVDFLSKKTLVVDRHLKSSIDDDNIFWINIHPYITKRDNIGAEVAEDKWQNGVIETRRLITVITNDNQQLSNDISANTNVVQSMIATKEALKSIHKLTSFYHESIIEIISNTEMANEFKSDILEIDKRIDQLQFAWFNKEKQLETARKQKASTIKELQSTENVIQSIMEMLDTETDNVANLIARITKYFKNHLIFQQNYLEDWLWRYKSSFEIDEQAQQTTGKWLPFLRQKSTAGSTISTQSKVTANELWSKLKTSVSAAIKKLEAAGNNDDGNFEEGLRIANQTGRLLEKLGSVANKI